jgi:hypothetical protein
LEMAKAGNDDVIRDFGGDMRDWGRGIRTELKRELARLGHYTGTIDDVWDDGARAAVKKYLGRRG